MKPPEKIKEKSITAKFLAGITRSPRNSIRLSTTGSNYAINSSQGSLGATNSSGGGGAVINAACARPRSLSVDRQDGGEMYERVSLLGNGGNEREEHEMEDFSLA